MFPFEGNDLKDLIPPDYRSFLESEGNEYSVFQEVCEGRSYKVAEAAEKLIQ